MKSGLASAAAFAAALVLAGCAGVSFQRVTETPPPGGETVFLTQAHPVAQKAWQCGPASLASVFGYWGRPADPDELAGRLTVGRSQGVLNIALAQAAKQNGFWTETGSLSTPLVKAHLRSGNPVIAMIDTSVLWLPKYHFIVLKGFDDRTGIFYANTGNPYTDAISYKEFERRWNRSGRWGLVIAPPDKVSWVQDPRRLNEIGLLAERMGNLGEAERRYRRALQKEPENDVYRFNLANALAAAGRAEEAEAAYSTLLQKTPGSTEAGNNLAWFYFTRGRLSEAADVIARVWRHGGERTPEILDTAGLVACGRGAIEEGKGFFEEGLKKIPDPRSDLRRTIAGHLDNCARSPK